jgi:hypothetical protein
MDMMKIQRVIDELKSGPEVTKSEAMACFMTMGDRVDSGDEEAIHGMAQMIGCAIMCDDPEMTRRFIKYVAQTGPL